MQHPPDGWNTPGVVAHGGGPGFSSVGTKTTLGSSQNPGNGGSVAALFLNTSREDFDISQEKESPFVIRRLAGV